MSLPVSLTAGQRLGPYEIVGALGAGGMGEVYCATDTRLNRQVALKILPDVFSSDPDRLARFRREAQVLASLNHPNIAAIYGFEDSPHALVMELVEGEDLSKRISRGAIAPEEALPVARQIADALEAAHEKGIIHRDLKPANIKIRNDGTVKVLDFGLARAMDPPDVSGVDAMNSPTLTVRATQMGVIIGTAAYMAPEQAKGRAVDKRADIWAFGVVLYEMLTGRQLFDAEDISETLAAVLTREISLTTLSADVPVAVRALLRDCLIRDPKQRLRDIGDARRRIEQILAGAPDDMAAPAAPVVAAAGGWKRVLPWTLAALTTAALVAVLVLWSPWTGTPAASPRRLLVSIGADASLILTSGPSAILSPDGTTLAFAAQQNGGASRLLVRTLDQLEAIALPGTDGAANPFFSPDGQWIGFFAEGSLKKVSVKGGAPLTVCAANSGRGGTWADDDTIFFSPNGGENTTIRRVPAAGGTPTVFGALSDGATTQRWPQALPDGAGVLYAESPSIFTFDSANLIVRPLDGGPPKVIVRGSSFGRYLAGQSGTRAQRGNDGFLVYVQQGTLFGARFDLSRLEVVGQAAPVLQGMTTSPGSGGAQLAFSEDGLLAYVPGAAITRAAPIDWTTREGKTSALRATSAIWQNPMFSPDGQKLVMDIDDGKQRDIWVYEWARDTLTQLTFDPNQDWDPTWTPDGRRIAFTSDRAKRGVFNLYSVNADGTGETTRLTDSPASQYPTSWHPGGRLLAYFQAGAAGPSSRTDLMMLPMEGEPGRGPTVGTPSIFLGTPARETLAQFSPDGRWVAYASDEANGRFEVYVRPFPGPGGQWRISTDGGSFPLWSSSARELLFTGAGGEILFASYTVVGDSFRADKPQVWTPTKMVGFGTAYPYAIHPDGKRIALLAQADRAGATNDKVVFDFNFVQYLKKTVPQSK